MYEHIDDDATSQRHDKQTLDTATAQQAADKARDENNMDVDDDDDDVKPHEADDEQVCHK